MTLLQQLDSIFSLASGLMFASVIVIVLVGYVLVQERKDLQLVADDCMPITVNDDVTREDYDAFCDEQANAYYDNMLVECVGTCGCGKTYDFTTTGKYAEDYDFATMIANSHCTVCNPEYDAMFGDDEHNTFEDTADAVLAEPVRKLTVSSYKVEGDRATFTFDDGSEAVMRTYTLDGCDTLQYDAPYREYHCTIEQARAIDDYTGTDCIPF